jgi:branched-chain amino acid transport system substrate-binding protein
VNVVKRLVNKDKVLAILGPNGSGEAIPVAPIVNNAKVPLIATFASNPKVTINYNGKKNEFVFRACFIDPYQGTVAANFSYLQLGKRKAAILFDEEDQYSVYLTNTFEDEFTRLGGNIVGKVTFHSNTKDFSSQIEAIKTSDPDILFSPNYYPDVALSARQARKMGLSCIMLGGDGWPSENLLPLAGNSLEGSYFVNQMDFDDPLVQGFKKEYFMMYHILPEINAYLMYDSIHMLVNALKNIEYLDGSMIAQELEKCDMDGLTGRIQIGKNTHNPEGKDAAIMKIEKNRMIFFDRYAVR